VIATCGAAAYTAAADLRAVGLEVTVVDLRQESDCAQEAAAARAAGCEVLTGHTILGSHGRKRVAGLVVAPVDASGAVSATRTLACDCVGLSGGWTPAVHLFSQSRGKLVFDATIDAFIPGASVQAERSAGAARGTYQLAACLQEAGAPGPPRRGSRLSARSRRARRRRASTPSVSCRAAMARGAAAPSSICRTM